MTTLIAASQEQPALSVPWGGLLFQVGASILLAFGAIASPVAATSAADVFIDCLMPVGGRAGLFGLRSVHRLPDFTWSLVPAALSVVAGGLLRWDPLAGTPSFTIVPIASA